MKALASFVMRGQTQAMLVVVGFAVLSLIIPLVSYISAAAVALVTLRQGPMQGLMLIVASSVFVGLVSSLSNYGMGMVGTMSSLGLLMVLLWALAIVLRQTRSMAATITVSALVGLAIILVFHLVIDDPALWWQSILREWFGPAIEQAGGDTSEMYNLLDSWAAQMTGFLAAAVVVNTLLCLFIARWWQAMLYNPGGFQQEFHALRLGQKFAIATLVVGVLAWVPAGFLQTLAQEALMLVMTIYVLQGLAVVHAIIALKKLQTAWFFGVYIMVILMSQLIAMVGFIDTWADFRLRLAGSGPGSGPDSA